MGVLDILTGPLLGGIGGAATAITTKVLDFKDAKDRRAHELAMRDKDRDLAALEFQHASEVAKVNADAQVATKEMDLQVAALQADRATYGDSWSGRAVDFLRGVIRPVVTIAYGSVLGWLTYEVIRNGPPITTETQRLILDTTLAVATGAITYWFGMRGGRR